MFHFLETEAQETCFRQGIKILKKNTMENQKNPKTIITEIFSGGHTVT
jgi:hypothetical protein